MTTDTNNASPPTTAAEEYKVGPGRPPKAFQFKPGQSGNPKGAKRKQPSIAADIKALLTSALNKTVTLKQGDNERTVTLLAAGIEQLSAQYAKGDRHARRDVIWFAEKFGVDLRSGGRVSDAPVAADHETILQTYVERQYDKVCQPPRVLAPPELLDDDQQHQMRS